MRHIVIVTTLVCALALALSFHASADSVGDTATTTTATSVNGTQTQATWTRVRAQRVIDRYRRRTWHWQRVMSSAVTWTLRHPPTHVDARIAVWKRIAVHTRRTALHPPHMRDWLCIHRFEAAWNDPNAPYYGGLQMDLGFQRTYGGRLLARKGTADRWTPLEQMWVAERALRAGRGFSAWPNTARVCGLL
jgi:hypothetical protein